MAWGARRTGLDDLAAKLGATEGPSVLRSLCIMSNRDMSVGLSVFCAALAANTTLAELLASGHSLSASQYAQLGEALRANRGLRTLGVGDSTMGDDGLAALVGAGLAENEGIEELDLAYKGITPRGVAALAAALAARQQRSEAQGQDAGGGGEGPRPVAYALRSLVLARNSIGDGGVAALVSNMNLRHLVHLGLSESEVGLDGVAGIAAFLRHPACSLAKLDLSYNQALGGNMEPPDHATGYAAATAAATAAAMGSGGEEKGTEGDGCSSGAGVLGASASGGDSGGDVLGDFAVAVRACSTLRELHLDHCALGMRQGERNAGLRG